MSLHQTKIKAEEKTKPTEKPRLDLAAKYLTIGSGAVLAALAFRSVKPIAKKKPSYQPRDDN